MGAVYLGEHAMLSRPAAIKILLPALSQNREMVGRFFNEARAATAIRHPGIVEIYDFGFLPDGAAYIAMEMLDGESLASRLRRVGRLPVGATIEIGRQVAAALHAAHSKGITHRDLKPDNVFLIGDPEIGERVKLLDFGIAKLITEDAGNRTRTGVVMGTPVYMSPEQCRGTAALDSRADLYSLGCMLYELLTGRPPFVADSAGEIIAHHLYFQPDPVRSHEGSVPEAFEQLIMSLLAKDPAMRPASAADVSAILDGWRRLAVASSGGAMPVTPDAAPVVRGPLGHVAASMPTTLSGAATAVPAAVGSRRRWFATAAMLVASIAAVVLVMRRPGTSTPVVAIAPDAVGAPPATSQSPPASSSPAPSPAASPPAVPPPAVPPPAVSPPAVPPPAVPQSSIASTATAPSTSLDRPAQPEPEPKPAEPPTSPAVANRPLASQPTEEPASRKAPQHVAVPSKPAVAPTRKSRDAAALAPAQREAPKPAATVATRPAEPTPAEHVEEKPGRSAESEASPKSEPKPAESSVAPKPTASKWGHLMGDKAPNAEDYLALSQCKSAAAKGDCPAARAIAARIADKNVAMYRARVVTDAAIAACLNSK